MNLADTQSFTLKHYVDTQYMVSVGYFECFEQGANCFEEGDYLKAMQQFKQALAIAEESQRKDLELDCYDQLSYCYFRRYEFDMMLSNATEALSLCNELDNESLKVTALNRIGIAYGSFGVNEEALKYFLESVDLAETTEHQDLPIIYNNISVIYYHLGNLHGSLPYLEKALALATKNDQKSHQLTCLCNFGQRYTEMGRYTESMQYLREALRLVKEFDQSNIIIVNIYENIGDCLEAQQKYTLAVKSYSKALSELRMRPNDHLKSTILYSLSKVYSKQNEHIKALDLLRQGLVSAEACNSLKTKFEIHKAMSDSYKGLGDFESALEHFEDFHNTRELVHDEDAKNRLQGMMVKFDVERVEKEKALAEKEQELAELKYVELAELNEKLEEQSVTDALTQIHNRRYLDQFLADEFLKALKLSRSLSVLMCDVDYFKQVNDNYSHAVGDDVLKVLAGLLKSSIRQDDLVARYGGEEFVIVFPQTQSGQAVKIAEKLRKIVEEYSWQKIAEGLKVTISLGVASGTQYKSYEKLLARADLKLYEAKDAGRNQVKY